MLSLICIGDGFGGADCVDMSGAKVYKKPSELLNFWMTTQADMQNFASWCYDTNGKVVESRMTALREEAQSYEVSPSKEGEKSRE